MEPSYDTFADVAVDRAELDPVAMVDVPAILDVLPDGRETMVIGDVAGTAEFNHQQGDNAAGFLGTCGIVACEGVLRQFGVDATETTLVSHAIENDQCSVTSDPEKSGGTTPETRVEILDDYGIAAHTESGQTLGDLAADVERGTGVIISANAGQLWNDPNAYEAGQSNHAVVVSGVARDPQTGEIDGFFINDSGTGEAGRFVDAATMQAAYVGTGGRAVVTDVVRGASVPA